MDEEDKVKQDKVDLSLILFLISGSGVGIGLAYSDLSVVLLSLPVAIYSFIKFNE